MSSLLNRRAILGLLAASAGQGAFAADPGASGKASILTISGLISAPGGKKVARFDRQALERLGIHGFSTATPWYKGVTRFDGVLMRDLLGTVGASGAWVTAIALNDYTTEIPTSDFEKYDVILALKRDGEYMPVRDKGPLFIVYPFDSDESLKSKIYYSRSAWQVSELIVH